MAYREIFSCGTQRVLLGGQDSSILPAQVAMIIVGVMGYGH